MRRGMAVPDHVSRNRSHWDQRAEWYATSALRDWASDEPTWGIWGVPESQVGMLPSELDGRDAIELGCGTAYVSAWLARRGARPVGIDNSEAQLETARRMQERFGLDFPLIHGNAERVPRADATFDIAISEYGASIWCDPYEWIPEAARLLRPGGELVFLGNSVLGMLCSGELGATGRELARPQFGMNRFEWPDDDSVEFHITHGAMIALLRDSGFEIEELIEVRPPPEAESDYDLVDLEWSRNWPCEEVWRARKR